MWDAAAAGSTSTHRATAGVTPAWPWPHPVWTSMEEQKQPLNRWPPRAPHASMPSDKAWVTPPAPRFMHLCAGQRDPLHPALHSPCWRLWGKLWMRRFDTLPLHIWFFFFFSFFLCNTDIFGNLCAHLSVQLWKAYKPFCFDWCVCLSL